MSVNFEDIWSEKFLIVLESDIKHFCFNFNFDVRKIGWHLEINQVFFIIFELDILKGLRNRDIIDIVRRCKCNLGIL